MTVAQPRDAVAADLEPAVERIHAHHHRFEQLLAEAEALARAAHTEDALRAAHQAAGWGWQQHSGIHVSPRLEAVVVSAAPTGELWRPRPRKRPAVLHVLSQAYATGGHTRWSDRIIRADTARTHSVLLTSQGSVPVPPWLGATVEASGGRLHVLPEGPLAARAAAVARLAADVDLVVANLHPDDVAGVAALADPRHRAPVATLNHADHAFWLGTGVADLLVDFRQSGQALSIRRRGVNPARVAVLPLPVDMPPRPARDDPDRATMRRAIGVRPDDVLLLAAGAPWKFDPRGLRGEPSFPEVLAPLVAADPRLRLLVLGPRPDGPWAAAARMTEGRMLAVGTRTDYPDLQLAADLYLDPFPMGSVYSLLEPASQGVAAVSLAQWPDEAAVLMANSPGLDGVRPVAHDVAEYEALVMGLVDDPAARRSLGDRLRAAIGATHAGEGWLAAFNAIVEKAPAAREAAMAGDAAVRAPDTNLEVPATNLLARGLAWMLERPPRSTERVRIHLPLARP